jgi:hypothetical protein
LAARFYLTRGYETIALSYLRNARSCYLSWGALGKVRQLDQHYPVIKEQGAGLSNSLMGAPVDQLDLSSVTKALRAVSGEIVLENLIETLMVIAVKHAGAVRGLLLLPDAGELRVEAEATTENEAVKVSLRPLLAVSPDLPESVVRYASRTQESVILEDALTPNPFSTDDYLQRQQSRSVLCLPLVKQTRLVGVLYLEIICPPMFLPQREWRCYSFWLRRRRSHSKTRIFIPISSKRKKIARIRTLFKKAETPKGPLDLNEAIREVIILTRSEMDKKRVSLRLELMVELPPILGDRVQLQQVVMNLILNAIESMSNVEGRSRELGIGTRVNEEKEILVTIRDSGVGLDPQSMEQVFAAFHTTKPGGLGMGLSISRSIVENHAGRLWASANDGFGATFQFTLPSSATV